MENLFLILGYGVPKDIKKDPNYLAYFHVVFNYIYNEVLERKVKKPIIMFAGGKTDMWKPYRRTEADEMMKLFKSIAQQKTLRALTHKWNLKPERNSLSGLENLLFTKGYLENKGIKRANIVIFCEQTRGKRIAIVADKVFNRNFNTKIVAVDFDVSDNRYRSPKFLKEKEVATLQHDLWALQNARNLAAHHRVYEEKLKYLRELGPDKHVEAVEKWWKTRLKDTTKEKR